MAIPVNTVGVAGAGLAKMAMPFGSDALKKYVHACRTRNLATGKVCIIETEINGKSVKFALTPTKNHWREKSAIDSVSAAIDSLRNEVEKSGIRSVAVPMLGCGLGRLDWSDVGRIIKEKLQDSHVIFLVHGVDPDNGEIQ
jgi:O-acetyl-ADP-ribose deacetylase (regulator of RNase III)